MTPAFFTITIGRPMYDQPSNNQISLIKSLLRIFGIFEIMLPAKADKNAEQQHEAKRQANQETSAHHNQHT